MTLELLKLENDETTKFLDHNINKIEIKTQEIKDVIDQYMESQGKPKDKKATQFSKAYME